MTQVSTFFQNLNIPCILIFINFKKQLGPKTSKSSKSKGGRGKSLGIKGWGGVVKRKVKFDEGFHPLDQALKTQLGVMVRNCYRVPLTYLEWEDVPNTIKEDIWKEVKVQMTSFNYPFICLHCKLLLLKVFQICFCTVV